MKVLAVNRNYETMTYGHGNNKVTIFDNKIISKCGNLTPVELAKAFKTYNKIFNG